MESSILNSFETSAGGQRAAGLLRLSDTPLEVMAELVFEEARSRLGSISSTRLCKAEQLCGADLWAGFPLHSQHRAIGMFMKHLVATGVLPLKLHKTKSGKGSRRYVLAAH